ncbi:MAG TPA: fumarylacetoacetase [Longimicrobiales bacterium]|nr:fumarylacetoacetase [Longimicrobiales bacterium]
MTREIDQTHDGGLTSWVASANEPGADFPIQNLPFGAFRRSEGEQRIGVAIGDRVLDLRALAERGLLGSIDADVPGACRAPLLNDLMALGPMAWKALRGRLSELLSNEDERSGVEPCLVATTEVAMAVPARVGDYTDFYASAHHATNVGRLFRPDEPLLPNYKWVPIGYHGRASSIVVSGHPVRRPVGQRRPGAGGTPPFGPSEMLDYEVEVGVFVGPGNELGAPMPVAEAEEHIFGVCLLNDWSARDIQAWEYQPLGPFLSKSFATTVSPWIVTMEALAPFRGPAFERDAGDPAPLPYLADGVDLRGAGVDVAVEAYLETRRMRDEGLAEVRLSRATTLDLYWTFAQMLAHHASNGCNMRPGDLFGSGTVSGAAADARGCLLEITRRGEEPVTLSSGETRTFLEDGDEVILRGSCAREGFRRIGLGECRGRVLRAPQ